MSDWEEIEGERFERVTGLPGSLLSEKPCNKLCSLQPGLSMGLTDWQTK